MTDDDILSGLKPVFDMLFPDNTHKLTRATTARDVEGWDSLRNIQVVVGAEQAFGVSFTATEIDQLPNVGALVDLIRKKKSG
jgi:acyl carrier protein